MFVWAEKKAQKLVVMCRCCDCSAKGLCVRLSMAMCCAERPGMLTMLWRHEFYMVMEVTYGIRVPSTRVQSREQSST